MTITVEGKTIQLSADFESRVRAVAEAEGVTPVDVFFHLAANALASEEAGDPAAVAEIAEAITRYNTMRAAGQQGIPAADVFADMRSAIHTHATSAGTDSGSRE